ncbi:TPR-like protein [Thozetella sp. PMI_491]|nr:TPR-like protein [Thozetella sp. PMI_491]
MAYQDNTTSFGSHNYGVQVGGSHLGTINNTIHLPSAKLTSPEQSETPPQPYASIPFCRDPDFVNRGDLLDQINQICLKAPYRAALVGLGGIGKSQLTIEYVHRLSEGTTGLWVFWVHAGTRARVEEGFRAIADMVKLAGRKQPKADIPLLVYHWLSNEQNGRWVIVLDSADDYDVLFGTTDGVQDRRALATYLPQSRNGCILATTRDKRLADELTGSRSSSIDVGAMTEGEALALLQKKMGPSPQWDREAAGTLVQALDLVPLAIIQAAAYIQARAPRSSIEKYLNEFYESERTKTRLLEHEVGDLRRDGGASNAVLTTWRISFDRIRSKQPSAADLLSLMSFFDRQGIPEWVLKADVEGPARGAANSGNESDGEWASQSDSNSDGYSNLGENGFEEDIAILRDFCLVTTNEQGDEFEMHSLVQLSTRKWLATSGQQERFQQQYMDRMAAAFPIGQYENWPVCQALFTHVQAALQYRPKDEWLDQWATLLYNGGWYAWLQGRYDIAERMAGMARKAREKRLGKEDRATLASTFLFAEVIRRRGRWTEAEMLFIQLIETCKAKLGAHHPDTLTSMASLASTYRNQGQWDDAERLEMEVMETRKVKLGADHPDTLTSMANLASTYRNQGRMANLASTYRNQGRWDDAERLDVEVLETRKAKLGADHPKTLTSMANLASTLESLGRHRDALVLMESCVRARQRILGQHHPDTLSSVATLEAWNR